MTEITLNKDLILVNIEAKNKEEALQFMGQNLYERGWVKESYTPAVIKRENVFATGLPTKNYSVAIPHTDAEHVNNSAISLGLLKEPVEFGVMGEDGVTTPVKLLFMLAMDTPHGQLKLLQKVMGILQDDQVLESIANENNKDEILKILNKKLQMNENN